jgi:hypothetical protein
VQSRGKATAQEESKTPIARKERNALRNAGLEVDMLVLVAMEARSSMDKDCRDTLGLFLVEAENTIECTVSSIIVFRHHGGNFIIVTTTAHALVNPWM